MQVVLLNVPQLVRLRGRSPPRPEQFLRAAAAAATALREASLRTPLHQRVRRRSTHVFGTPSAPDQYRGPLQPAYAHPGFLQ